MLADKDMKLKFKELASKNPEKYYPIKALEKEGFKRKQCIKCKIFFWTANDSEVCGDICSGGFGFIGNSPAKYKLDYIEVWDKFSKIFKKLGYTPIKRYPVAARWRGDTDFVQASIYDFQPYVVSGEVEPPANPLTVPQFCLRFNDIDNVGLTGAHYTGFVMIGQHAFMPPKDYNQEKYFEDIHTWLKKGIGIKNQEITFHEDGWAGGGNVGPCIEFFSRGLELGNQVYITHEQTPAGLNELNLKILDMGMGHERNSWFTQGTSTSYETAFPTVIKKLTKETNIEVDNELMKKFLPYSAFLKVDEADNVKKVWLDIAEKIKIDVNELRRKVLPLAALYSIAEHSRSLLVAIGDSVLPSNIGGGYNLRVILRRALSLIKKYNWDINLPDLCKEHAKYLKPLFPELRETLPQVQEILEVEKRKYLSTKEKSGQIIKNLLEKEITEDILLKVYDTQGISPELIKEEAEKFNKKIHIPDNFYAKVTKMHENIQKVEEEKKEMGKLQVKRPPATEILYYDDPIVTSFKAKVINIINDKFVILDRTAFYPRGGGQEPDMGLLNNTEVLNVFKQGDVIIHELKENPKFNELEEVNGKINLIRRKQLMQHHTATHIINAAARKVLGHHVNQAGAFKGEDRARIDITHYEAITEEQERKIEDEANRIIKSSIKVKKESIPRNLAEKEYGMTIYQGGVVPGKNLRIINIVGIDVECCGGTHANNTSEIELIKILRSTKISDSIIRIEFVAGEAAREELEKFPTILKQLSKTLSVAPTEVVSRSKDLFEKWRLGRKAIKKEQKIFLKDLQLSTPEKDELNDEDSIKKIAEIFKTQPEHIVKTAERFIKELEEYKSQL